jgi:hypothetical protein
MVITTEAEYDRLRTTVDELMNGDEDDLSSEEVKLLDLLVTLIDRYEERTMRLSPAHARNASPPDGGPGPHEQRRVEAVRLEGRRLGGSQRQAGD